MSKGKLKIIDNPKSRNTNMRLGVLSTPGYGHIGPLAALSQSLGELDHQIFFFSTLDGINRIGNLTPNITPVAISQARYPDGSIPNIERQHATKTGMTAIKQTFAYLANLCEVFLDEIPPLVEKLGIDALIVDQVLIAGTTIAEETKKPYITIATTITLNPHPSMPPYFTTWRPRNNLATKALNTIAYAYVIGILGNPIRRSIESYRRKKNLECSIKISFNAHVNSKHLVILNCPRSLEFPNNPEIKEYFFFAGHLERSNNDQHEESFLGVFDSDMPLIYASLGTVRNGCLELYRKIALACRDMKVQLLMSAGGNLSSTNIDDLPKNATIVPFLQQKEVLGRASVFVTHSGMNSVLESVTRHTPLVFLPQSDDQYGVAVRGEAAGLGIIAQETVTSIQNAVLQVLGDDRFRKNTLRIAQEIIEAGGTTTASKLISNKLLELHKADQ